MVVKNTIAKHLEYALELVNDQSVVEEPRQNLFFEVVASSATEQYPVLSNILKTENALNPSVNEGQIRVPERMVVLIEDDNVISSNETDRRLSDEKGALEIKLVTEVSQLFYQMVFGRDDVDFLTGITLFDDSGTPADNRCLTSTWQHTDVGRSVVVHVLLEGRLSHNSCLERTGFKEDSGLLFFLNFFAEFHNLAVVLSLFSIEELLDFLLQLLYLLRREPFLA